MTDMIDPESIVNIRWTNTKKKKQKNTCTQFLHTVHKTKNRILKEDWAVCVWRGKGGWEHFNYNGKTSNRNKVEHTVPCKVPLKTEGKKDF